MLKLLQIHVQENVIDQETAGAMTGALTYKVITSSLNTGFVLYQQFSGILILPIVSFVFWLEYCGQGCHDNARSSVHVERRRKTEL